jgi:hypothetical protein
MGGWDEEVWFSLYSAALLAEALGHRADEVVDRYLRAFDHRPARGGEALGQLARYCREARRFASARLFSSQAMLIPLPSDDGLFVDASWYRWRCRDEFAVASYWSGDPESCRRVCRELLSDPALPAEHVARMRENLAFAEQRIASAGRA